MQASNLLKRCPSVKIFARVFALSEPICVCDLGTGKKSIFYQLTPDFDGFCWVLPHTECAVKQKLNLKLGQT
jgi:hypothetical protein